MCFRAHSRSVAARRQPRCRPCKHLCSREGAQKFPQLLRLNPASVPSQGETILRRVRVSAACRGRRAKVVAKERPWGIPPPLENTTETGGYGGSTRTHTDLRRGDKVVAKIDFRVFGCFGRHRDLVGDEGLHLLSRHRGAYPGQRGLGVHDQDVDLHVRHGGGRQREGARTAEAR